ncbi:MAG: DUF1893 domain-containing protein [bacterium]|nr:DUF1893 domain-containing protein [bacterium]
MFLIKEKFKKFLNSSWELEIWQNDKIIFRSKKSGVRGLLDFINKHGNSHSDLVIFDKIVGRGAALLAIYLKAKIVYGELGSKLAARALRKYKIEFHLRQICANILNRDKSGLCPIERLSLDKTPEEFYICIGFNYQL